MVQNVGIEMGTPSIYKTIKEEISHHIERNNRYTRKQRPGAISPSITSDHSNEPHLQNKHYYEKPRVGDRMNIATEKFVGSGGF